MGTSSNTLHLRHDDQQTVLRAYGNLLRRRGYRLRAANGIPHFLETQDETVFRRIVVSRPRNGWITIIDQRFDDQNLRAIDRISSELSGALECSAVALILHDSEALYLMHWHRGQRMDRWCSWPGWYSDQPVTAEVRKRWRGHPSRLLPLCIAGVTEERLVALMRDYSGVAVPFDNDGLPCPIWPEKLHAELSDALGLVDGPRTFAGIYATPKGLYLAMPGGDDRSPVRIDRGPDPDPYWEDFIRLHFVRL